MRDDAVVDMANLDSLHIRRLRSHEGLDQAGMLTRERLAVRLASASSVNVGVQSAPDSAHMEVQGRVSVVADTPAFR
jgi:hypothetical protein